MPETDWKAIKILQPLYESLIELKKVIALHGYNGFSKEFLDFLQEEGFDISKFSISNMVNLSNLCLKFFFENEN